MMSSDLDYKKNNIVILLYIQYKVNQNTNLLLWQPNIWKSRSDLTENKSQHISESRNHLPWLMTTNKSD